MELTIEPAVEKNPYGYKQKEIAASGKEFLIGISGSDAHQFLNEGSKQRSMIVEFKNKEVQVALWPENLIKEVDLSVIQQLEDAGLFSKKPQFPKSQALVFRLGNFDENEFGGVFDSNFLFTIKIENVERYTMFRLLKNEQKQGTNHIPNDIFAAAGRWIGSVLNITAREIGCDYKAVIRYMGEAITKEYSNPDYKKLHSEHKYLSDARWGTLKKFQSYSVDPLKTTDPLGNTVAHLAVHNQFLDVFMHIAKKYPALLSAQNIFGNTPLHHLALLHIRYQRPKYFDWKLIWELPWNFSIKNKAGETGLEKLCNIRSSKEIVLAINTLLLNEKAWNEVKKCHDHAQLLTSVVVIYLSDEAKKVSQDEALKTVKLLVEHGATGKDLILHNALKYRHPKVANYALENGATVSDECVVAAVSTLNREVADIALKRFDLNLLSKEHLNVLCKEATLAGWTDLVTFAAKKGCELFLNWNEKDSTTLAVANIIAKSWARALPLRYLCVDAMHSSVPKGALNNTLATLPEEMKDLFHEKELWRWTLFLKDGRRNRILQLYRAIHRAQRSEDKKSLQINLGSVEFSVASICKPASDWNKFSSVGLNIWPGKLTQTPPEDAYEILSYEEADTRSSMPPRKISSEKNEDALDKILGSLVWPKEEDYVFLFICYYAFSATEGEDYNTLIDRPNVKKFFFPEFVDDHIAPPDWYTQFLRETYGIHNIHRRRRIRAGQVQDPEFNSLDES